MEMKTGFWQILHVNPFARIDHEDHIAHLGKFYEKARLLGVFDFEEWHVSMRLFPHYLIGKVNDWYFDQLVAVIQIWTYWKTNSLTAFILKVKWWMQKPQLLYSLKEQLNLFLRHKNAITPCLMIQQIFIYSGMDFNNINSC